MWLYILIFSIPSFYYLIGEKQSSKGDLFLPIYMVVLALFVGLSDMFGGYDRYIYGQVFDSIANGVSSGVPAKEMDNFNFYEWGYSMFSWIVAHFTANRYIFILVVTMTIYINLYVVFKRHVQNYPFAFIIFFGLLFFFTFTYLRQVLAVSIAVLSIKPLKEKNYLQFVIIMFIVFLMHKSGIIFGLMVFVPRKRLSIGEVIILLLVCLVIGASGVLSNIIDVYELSFVGSEGVHYVLDSGFRVAYLLEAFLFVSIILFNYDKIADTEENMLFLNMAFMFCAILLLFIRSDNGGRMAWYFIIGLIITLTNIISHHYFGVFPKFVLVLLFFGLYLRVYNAWQELHSLYPYKTFFSNGYRENDHYWMYYEYDHNYDNNKLYRTPFRYVKEWKYSE